jgi:hypothetical protein
VPKYEAFGFTIEAEIELPELAPNRLETAATDWTIRVDATNPPPGTPVPLGVDTVFGDVRVHAFGTVGGVRLVFDDTGAFDVSASERTITWHPGPRADESAVRADLLGRVIGAAAHVDGRLALHASAVSVDGRALVCLGPKQVGKSTLAMALVRHGARLLTDDTLAVRFDGDGTAWAAPGVQRVRLWDDAARALDVVTSGARGAKPTVGCLTSNELESREVRVAACYVLHAGGRRAHAAAVREPLSPVHAAIACLRFSRLGPLAGGREGQVVLDRVARLARAVPVFDLTVRRDLAMLDDAAALVVAWHGAKSRAAAEAGR